MRNLWTHSLLALLLLLLFGGAARAQAICPQVIAPKIVPDTSYTVTTPDYCWWVVLTNTGAVNVKLPAPGLIFPAGFTTTILPLGVGTITFSGLQDQAGVVHQINGLSTLSFGPGVGAVLKIQQDMNWYAVPTGAFGSGGGQSGFPIALGSTPIAAGSTTPAIAGLTLVAPALGTPVSGVATNLTGTAAGLTAGTVTTNANLTGPIISVGNATSIASQTGTGTTFAMSVGPTFTGSFTAIGLVTLPDLATQAGRTLLGNTTTSPGAVTAGWTPSGTASVVATTTGALTNGHCVDIDVNGNLVDSGGTCSSGGGGGSVTSVGLSVPMTSIFGATGSPVTTAGTLGLTTTGTSGGVPYFGSTSQLVSSPLLTANAFLTGGGVGAAPNAVAIAGLVLGNGASAPTAYGGATACSANNFVTALSAAGATTCGSSTISGISLGSNLDVLTFGTHLAAGGSSFNGSANVTITSDATSNNNASAIVARDVSGNFAAGVITAANIIDTGIASGQLLLGGGSSALTGLAEVDGDCVIGSSGTWTSGACGGGSGFPITLGSTSIAASSTTPTIAGLTLVAPTVTGSFTATGLVTNAALAHASTTVNGQPCTLGGACVVSASSATYATKTTAYSILSTDNGTWFNNSGAGGAVVLSLPPAPAANQTNCAFVTVAQTVEFLAPASTKIAIGITNSGIAGNIQYNVPFSNVCIWAQTSTQWIAYSMQGSWTVSN